MMFLLKELVIPCGSPPPKSEKCERIREEPVYHSVQIKFEGASQ